MPEHELRRPMPFRCTEKSCRRGFSYKKDLVRHERNRHGSGSPISVGYVCAACPDVAGSLSKFWPRRDNFKAHIKRKHPDWPENDLLERSQASHPYGATTSKTDTSSGDLADLFVLQPSSQAPVHRFDGTISKDETGSPEDRKNRMLIGLMSAMSGRGIHNLHSPTDAPSANPSLTKNLLSDPYEIPHLDVLAPTQHYSKEQAIESGIVSGSRGTTQTVSTSAVVPSFPPEILAQFSFPPNHPGTIQPFRNLPTPENSNGRLASSFPSLMSQKESFLPPEPTTAELQAIEQLTKHCSSDTTFARPKRPFDGTTTSLEPQPSVKRRLSINNPSHCKMESFTPAAHPKRIPMEDNTTTPSGIFPSRQQQSADLDNTGTEGSLQQQIDQLQKYIQSLEQSAGQIQRPSSLVQDPWLTLYRVYCPITKVQSTYIDRPIWTCDEGNHFHLNGARRIAEEASFEAAKVQIDGYPFVKYLEYDCQHSRQMQPTLAGLDLDVQKLACEMIPNPFKPNLQDPFYPVGLEMKILSKSLLAAIDRTFANIDGLEQHTPFNFKKSRRLKAPFIMYLEFDEQMSEFGSRPEQCSVGSYRIFLDFLQAHTAELRQQTDELFGSGLIQRDFMPCLFQPGNLLLKRNNDRLVAVKQLTCLVEESARQWACECRTLRFDGNFHYSDQREVITFPPTEEATVPICSLDIYPLARADVDVEKNLLKRGEFLYSCRAGRYVSGPSPEDDGLTESRYMVDPKTYHLIHPSQDHRSGNQPSITEEGTEEFCLMLPAEVQGFHMQDKKWVKLDVSTLKAVDWNKQAFETLAVEDETKELVQALVTKKIEADKGTDLVSGKGTGLILLLHGGPGTGKTLTAESVAEIAKKPLYRVSCGDVGTKPKDVETYLEQVFQLGRIWGCVVLLDEAEVFLERRSFANLDRNALVSVFLRVLEYYDGILLLTSNRVGTFDEAFKSRIQLALHYEPLNESQRRRIWDNFLNRLQGLDEDVDFDDIRQNLKQLTRHKMNG